jgi:hypothetical protein
MGRSRAPSDIRMSGPAHQVEEAARSSIRQMSHYRIVPQSIIRYGVEVTEPNKAPRTLLTCPTEAAADAWMVEIKRLSAVKL